MTKERLNALKEQIKRFNFQFVLEIIEELEKENKELEKAITEKNSVIEKMKCCDNCKHCHRQYEDIYCDFKNEYDDVICSRGYNGEIDGWELAE